MKIIWLIFIVLNIYAQNLPKISPLGWAIINKDIKQAKELIKSGVDLRSYENQDSIKKIVTPNVHTTYVGMDTEVYPLVILAATNGMDEVLKLMKNKDEQSIYLKDIDGNDALMWASRQGYLSTVKLLLEYGFDPLYKTAKYKESAYELALNKSKHEVSELFIDTLIKENRTDILPYTIWRLILKDTKTIEKLLKLGIKDSYKAVAPKTSLMRAAKYGKLNAVKLLIKYGSNPYEANEGSLKYGYNPLTLAINSGQDDVVKYLLENYNYDLKKIFDVENQKAFIMQKVLSSKYGIKIESKIIGNNYLHIAVGEYVKLEPDVFLLLVQKSQLDINSLDKHGKSLLEKIVAGQRRVLHSGKLEDIKFLLSLDFSKQVLQDALKSAKKNIDRYTEEKRNGFDSEHRLKNAEKIYSLIEVKCG